MTPEDKGMYQKARTLEIPTLCQVPLASSPASSLTSLYPDFLPVSIHWQLSDSLREVQCFMLQFSWSRN